MNPDVIRPLVKRTLTLRDLQKPLSRHVAVGILCDDKDDVSSIRANGSLSLIQFPHEKLLVTAFHVWDRFMYADPPSYIAACCSEPDELGDCFVISESEIVSSSHPLDITVLRPPSILSLESRGKVFAPTGELPWSTPNEGDPVIVVGSPGQFREDISTPDMMAFATHGFFLQLKVISVTETKLWIELGGDFDEARLDVWNTFPIDWHTVNWGGLSGAPVFTADSNGTIRPCAILTDATDGIEGRFLATRLDCLDDRGQIENVA